MFARKFSPWAVARLAIPLAVVVAFLSSGPHAMRIGAQDRAAPGMTEQEIERKAAEDVRRAEAQKAEGAKGAPAAEPSLNPVDLYWSGGIFMHPILALSFLVVGVTIERMLALRRGRVMPDRLVDGLGQLAASPEGFDPKKAYRVCQQYPSAASNVIRAMLLKVGRPHSEVEHAVALASDREATLLYGNIRWLTLSASVGPLLGLLGTVQGMIMAFYVTATAPAGVNKAQMLAEGIYVALVTTFAGLCVAIPAVMIAYWLEGRIQGLFRGIDDLTSTLLPHIERFEGKLRATPRSLAEADRPGEPVAAATIAK